MLRKEGMDMKLDEKLSLALRITSGKVDLYGYYIRKIYPFTTENIAGYIPKFKLKNTKLLTVGSSCDQAINAALYGCRDITILDICPFTKEYFYLKSAAIQEFDKKSFENFFFGRNPRFKLLENKKALNPSAFAELEQTLKCLDEESYELWSKLLSTKGTTTIRSELFSSDERNPVLLKRINPYLRSEENYLKTREALKNTKVTFITGDIMSEELLESETYDNIFLSNIPCNYSLEKTNKLVTRTIPNLRENGKMLISYLYQLTPSLDYCKEEPEIYNVTKAIATLPKPVTLTRFESSAGSFYADGALIYQKKK